MSSPSDHLSEFLKQAIQKNLGQLVAIKEELEKKNTKSPELLTFWKGLVRDDVGKWENLRLTRTKYFQYGAQPKPDLTNTDNVALIIHTLQQERQFLIGLQNGNFHKMKNWIISLHNEQAYKGVGGEMMTQRLISTHEHTEIVHIAIVPLAVKYKDPYTQNGLQIVYLPSIDHEGLPMDKWTDSDQVMHYYPEPRYFDQYLSIMEEKLQEFTLKAGKETNHELLKIISCYYQYAINMHMFGQVNQSLFADHVNAMLTLIGLHRTSQGIMDFAALRLQPENFTNFFIDQVMEANIESSGKLVKKSWKIISPLNEWLRNITTSTKNYLHLKLTNVTKLLSLGGLKFFKNILFHL